MLFTFNKIRCFLLSVTLFPGLLIAFQSCQRKEYTREEAIRSLKVLNGDVSGFLTKAGEMEEMAALRFLWDHDSLPLPFPLEKYVAEKPWNPYDFESSKGLFVLDSSRNLFRRTGEDKGVRLEFSNPKIPDGEFLLSEYEAAKISSRPDFPLKLKALLTLNGVERLTISHVATVTDDLPETINLSVKTEDDGISYGLQRTRKNDSGVLFMQLAMEKKGYRFIHTLMEAKIGYSSMGYYFEDIQFTLEVFSHLATGTIRYGKIDPTSKDYASSFNANSDIRLFEMPGNRLVGKLVLNKSPKGDLLDYFIRFKDGSLVPVSEYLPFLDKLLNMKL